MMNVLHIVSEVYPLCQNVLIGQDPQENSSAIDSGEGQRQRAVQAFPSVRSPAALAHPACAEVLAMRSDAYRVVCLESALNRAKLQPPSFFPLASVKEGH